MMTTKQDEDVPVKPKCVECGRDVNDCMIEVTGDICYSCSAGYEDDAAAGKYYEEEKRLVNDDKN